jgi:transcription elongation factor GreA
LSCSAARVQAARVQARRRRIDYGFHSAGLFRSRGVGIAPADCGFLLSGPAGKEPAIMSTERIPITREGYDKLKADLDYMQSTKMIELTKRVAEARAMGDLSENAEYHAAREDQGQLQAKIDELKNRLALSEIIDRNNIVTDAVAFGATVRVKDLDIEEEEVFILVGPGEEDYSQNRILTNSPIGKGLLGKKKGEVAEIQVPMGTVRFQVVEISFG